MKKIAEKDLLLRLRAGEILLPPLNIRSRVDLESGDPADARIELSWGGQGMIFPFVVEAKTQSTPLAIQNAIRQAKSYQVGNELPMIMVPYLAPERLQELEQQQISGVDLCGNGIVVVPGQLCIFRTGQPNRFPESRPLNNPYRGRSALVARMLLMRPRWQTLNELTAEIQKKGGVLSLPQASKAVQALEEDLILSKRGGIILQNPLKLLDQLAANWTYPSVVNRQALRLSPGTDWARSLAMDPFLRWSVTGESSVTRYASFSQGGPIKIAVSDLDTAIERLGGIIEPALNFADIELLETEEPGFFFAPEIDSAKVRWANRIQTWLELQAGDARQTEAARDVRKTILEVCKND